MKFTKFGKALLISALSAGVVLGVSSCIQSYTVGYIYITGTVTGESDSNGIISGYKIDHNTGKLTEIHGLPVSSGGANPVRAILVSGSRFLYVLNRGVNANGTADCSGTTGSTVCNGANITLFAIGGNGILTPQGTYYTQGQNPTRIITDSTGSYLMALDHDAPSSTVCQKFMSTPSCGDITVFKIDSTTGRLSLVTNAQGTTTLGATLTYFPVPAKPIDFILNSSYVLTLAGDSTSGDSVYPYAYASGQLTNSQSSVQPLGIYKATGLVVAASKIYVMDNAAPSGTNSTGATSKIIPYTVGTAGALQAETTGQVANTPTLSNPSWIIADSKSKFLYIANQGNNVSGVNAGSGITGYSIITSPTFQLSFTTPAAFGTGSGPQCIVEDPSDQFIYTANYNDSTVTGSQLDPNRGVLSSLRGTSTYKLNGPATWCLVSGRTN